MSFMAMLGHKEQERRLARALQQDALVASLLVTGPIGIGKTLFAKKLACALLSYDAQQPANAETLTPLCAPVVIQRMREETHPDLVISALAPKESPVEHIRSILKKIYTKPTMAPFKVVIFENADEFNRNAANALLKTLEEPPMRTFIILTSSHPERLLPTIRSRCLRVTLAPLSATNMGTVLKRLHIALEPSLVSLCDGSPGTALMLYERADVHRNFFEALNEDSLAKAQVFAEEEEAWPLFSWLAPRTLHRVVCAEDTEATPLRAHALTLWQDVLQKIMQAERLNLDRKAVMLWFLCSLREVLHRKAC
ncbi:MAG: AAA family ATPase [Holosporales bacterium]|jgi:DNA polymerase-3 subunit delta'|nr:AAA family ATPase [Holosporales bacterium]